MLNHNYIGTEHILLGLIREGEGVAAQVLESLNISLEAARQKVDEAVGQGKAPVTGHIPFTPKAKKVLELSFSEALQLRHNYIGTEHILLGLIREGEGVAAQVLRQFGVDLETVRRRVLEGQDISAGDASVAEALPGPACPRCRGELATYAAYHTITVPDEDETAARQVLFVFCRNCNNTLGVLPGESAM